jgi:hypothetical protein
MEAHAKALDLKAVAPYFYDFGLAVQKLVPHLTQDLRDKLAGILKSRGEFNAFIQTILVTQ